MQKDEDQFEDATDELEGTSGNHERTTTPEGEQPTTGEDDKSKANRERLRPWQQGLNFVWNTLTSGTSCVGNAQSNKSKVYDVMYVGRQPPEIFQEGRSAKKFGSVPLDKSERVASSDACQYAEEGDGEKYSSCDKESSTGPTADGATISEPAGNITVSDKKNEVEAGEDVLSHEQEKINTTGLRGEVSITREAAALDENSKPSNTPNGDSPFPESNDSTMEDNSSLKRLENDVGGKRSEGTDVLAEEDSSLPVENNNTVDAIQTGLSPQDASGPDPPLMKLEEEEERLSPRQKEYTNESMNHLDQDHSGPSSLSANFSSNHQIEAQKEGGNGPAISQPDLSLERNRNINYKDPMQFEDAEDEEEEMIIPPNSSTTTSTCTSAKENGHGLTPLAAATADDLLDRKRPAALSSAASALAFPRDEPISQDPPSVSVTLSEEIKQMPPAQAQIGPGIVHEKRPKRKKNPWNSMPFYQKRIRELGRDEEVAAAIPDGATSVVHVMGRRVNLARYEGDLSNPDLYAMARDWIEDKPSLRSSQQRGRESFFPHRPCPPVIQIGEKVWPGVAKHGSEANDQESDPELHSKDHIMDRESHDKSLDSGKTIENDAKLYVDEPEGCQYSLRMLISRGKGKRAVARAQLAKKNKAAMISLQQKGIVLPPRSDGKG